MPKNIVQDVVPPNRRSIRDVPLGRPPAERPEPTRRSPDSDRSADNRGGWRFSNWMVWSIGAVSAVALVLVFGNIFSRATISATPRTEALTINDEFTAKPATTGKALSYTSLSLAREREVGIRSDGERLIETPAAGTIVIYNNYSSGNQRLVKNTRFETPDGLIFRIKDSVVIPGRHNVGGKVIPGSVTAAVTAESPGEEYNIGLTDFTVPGFKSNPERFKNFYARSKTPMKGGFVGMTKSVSDEKMVEARARLEGEMKASFLAEAKAAVPKGSVFYADAYRISFDVLPNTAPGASDKVTLHLSGRFTAYFFPRAEIARSIAENLIPNFGGAPVTTIGEENLSFAFLDPDTYSPTTVGPVRFRLTGNTSIVWTIDGVKLRSDLAGKSRKALSEVISRYPNIIAVEAVIRPFWKSSFPSAERMKVVATIPAR